MSNSKYGIERAGGRLALTPQVGGNVLVSLTSTINPDGRLNALSVTIADLKDLVDEVYATGEFPTVPYARAYLHSRYGTPPTAQDTTKTHHRGSAIELGETQEEYERRVSGTYTAEDVRAAYSQGRRDAAKGTQAYTQGWADGHRRAASDTTPASIAQHLSMDVLEAAWEAAEVAEVARQGDQLIRRNSWGSFHVSRAVGGSNPIAQNVRILQRAPRPQLEVPTDSGVRFIAHSSAWCDDPEDQWEFIAAGPSIVRVDGSEIFQREAFEAEWTVTGLVGSDG